ncbi:hypothetical protein VTN00DRAFT_6959 [Thermoascus crustaceus]|uniref:uncharacterized protein n=1 Tax=Thermoascus crustaceus TaxID=5088 RepID=UPI00374289CC
MSTNHYGIWFWDRDNNGYGWASVSYIHSLYVKNETWYRTARVIQSIVVVLTIPLTSAVCSSAAVIYVQRCRHASPSNFTIRQLMNLADKGWTDPTTYTRLLFKKGGWKCYGSGFLVLAVLLNVLGGIMVCMQGGVALGNMSLLQNPFLAQLPSDYGTGLIRQFVPRFNSTAKIQGLGGGFPS